MKKCLQCGNTESFLLTSIDTGKRILTLCPNDDLMFYYGHLELDNLENIPSTMKKNMECAATGKTEDVWLYTTLNRKQEPLSIPLHQKELYDLIGRKLKPASFKKLVQQYGIFHEIHDDFYDEFGNAVQPFEDYYEDFQNALQGTKS